MFSFIFTNPDINRCCAVTFITDLTHASLGMSKEEFDTQMRDGVSVTLCPVEIPGALFENESRYRRISDKIENLEAQMLSSERDLQFAHEDLMSRISELRTTYPRSGERSSSISSDRKLARQRALGSVVRAFDSDQKNCEYEARVGYHLGLDMTS
ncbi:unnamed protein product [Dibothriocephalus latus]|uniref:Uncharacterized protein n=1 Tax=Dibothriocephalus latus TaxID=60516 RepID=A0A3P6TCS5_DIBLA|nr:unnamed protein product [Dibothriocephalus latus]